MTIPASLYQTVQNRGLFPPGPSCTSVVDRYATSVHWLVLIIPASLRLFGQECPVIAPVAVRTDRLYTGRTPLDLWYFWLILAKL